jgi:ABC-type antimicrobial peptide transport system permease subunit
VTFAIVQRTREFGVRMALGATKGDLARTVASQTVAPILAGIVLGLGAAAGLAGFAGSLLYEVNARDAASFRGAALLLACVGLAASYPPVRRVFHIDPAGTLRSE